MIKKFFPLILFFFVFVKTNAAQAWGRRGHALINATAAYLLDDKQKDDFFGMHSFDLSYYGNIPDILWKNPDTYALEHKEHYMDKEIFDRAFQGPNAIAGTDPLSLSRADFNKKFPDVPESAGRSFWRIRELEGGLENAATRIHALPAKISKAEHEQKFALQAQWLLLAGLIGHYVGDLSQPLHVTENFDGAQSGQNGVHAFFEETLVDALYPELELAVLKAAREQWPGFHHKHEKLSTLALLEELQKISYADLQKVLEIDKKIGRKDLARSATANREVILTHLTQASLFLAEIWQRHLGWSPDNERFFIFLHKPAYIPPGQNGILP